MLVGACCVPATAQTLQPGWSQQFPANNPGPRFEASLTYDAGHNQVVLFSGNDSSNDTWLWNGSNWTQANPANSPSARYGAAMVYDPVHGNVVLFGGTQNSDSSRQGDTWLWDGSNWTEASTTGPTARNGAALVYDAATSQLLLFGGTNGTSLNDTWTWNGTTWTQLLPGNSPGARSYFGMVYDAAQSEVVLFGGSGQSGYLNDTWAWNGTTWTLLNPVASPPAREGAGMAYNAALGEAVMLGGYDGSYLADTWIWNGTNWAQQTTSVSPSARLAPNGMTYDSMLGQVILYSGINPAADTWEWGSQENFGNANVCPSGQTSPAPCGETLTLTYNIASTTTINSIQVLTQGTSGIDFTLSSGSTCTGTVAAGTCTVNVLFAPLAPGLRLGAVELFGAPTTPLVTTPIYGVGLAPVAAFPGTANPVSTGSYSLAGPKGVTVDAAGNLYIADTTNERVLKVPASGTPTTVGTGWMYPQGLAVDGAGDLYVADNNLNEVVKVPAGCTSSACQVVVGSGLSSQLGVAVDGAGDVFISSFYGAKVVEVPANGSPQTAVYSPGGSSQVVGIAVDGAGDLFVADFGLKEFVEVPAGCASSACQLVYGSGWSEPEAIAVDAAGDVFVADLGLGQVVEFRAGCTSISCGNTVFYGSGTYGVAVDGTGDIYVPVVGTNQVWEIQRSQPPSLIFLTPTDEGSQDTTDGAQEAVLQNVGNTTLSFPVPATGNDPSIGRDFSLFSSGVGDCPLTTASSSSPGTLAPGASCVYSVTFDPMTAGNLSESLVVSDNSLNAVSPPATQTIPLSGFGLATTYTIGGTVTGLVGNGLVLQDNLVDNLSIGGNGAFTFATALNNGSPYTVTVLSQPPGQSCTVTNGSATVADANVTSVQVSCTTLVYYTLTVSGAGSGTGIAFDNQEEITCSAANGSVSGTCTGSYLSGTLVTLTASGRGTSTFQGWGGACASAGTSSSCSLTMNAALNATAIFNQQSLGNVNVCPSGQTTPAPCSGSITLTYNLAATTTLGVIQALTQGVSGLDFSLGSGGTCAGTISAGSSCTVNVKFTPLAPGLRLGAVRLFDNNGNVVASTSVYGVGQGPAIAFAPGTQIAISPGSYSLGSPQGIAVDAAGNVFIADYGKNRVVEVPGGGGAPGLVNTGSYTLNEPFGLALDGAGDLFIANYGSGQVIEVPAVGTASLVSTGSYTLSGPEGLAVDGAGDLFIASSLNGQAIEVPAGGAPILVNTGAYTLGQPSGVAVDAAGDVFIADQSKNDVVEVTAGGTPALVSTGSYALNFPQAVALDAAGDVLIADTLNNRILQVTPGGSPSILESMGTGQPYGIAVDGTGDLFTASTGTSQVLELARFLPPSLSFALTNVSSTSVDSPRLVSVQNAGNQTLTGSLVLSLGSNFGANGTCGSGFALAPGASCSESFSFTPQGTGYLTGTASFSDNTLNLAASVVLQSVNLSGNGGLNGQAVGVVVPNVVGLTQTAAGTTITGVGLAMGTVSSAASSIVPSGSVIDQNPAAGAQVSNGTAVRLLVSTGAPPPQLPNPLSFENNYFVTGDYAAAGVTLRGTGHGGVATNTITIPDSTTCSGGCQGVPDGADIIDAFLYWETLENTPSPSATSGTFNGYAITGQQIGSDLPYTDGAFTGTLRAYRADVNTYFPVGENGVRFASGGFTVSLPDGGSALPLTEGASLVVIYRVLSPNFPLKAVVIYDGAAIPTTSTTQTVQGFYDPAPATGPGESTTLFDVPGGGGWSSNVSSVSLGQSSQYTAPLNAGNAYAAVILSTPVLNTDKDGILDSWKAGPPAGDFYAGQPGYYDVKTGQWVPLPGAKSGEKDLFVQFDYMCGAVLPNGECDPNQENLYPSPDSDGNDPLAMVTQAYAADGIALHLQVGNAVPESTCTDATNGGQLCQFPGEPGVISWKNSLEFSKLWPKNITSCAAGGDCSPRFPYGQKDSYHYVLFGHSLTIPAWNTRYGTIKTISVSGGTTTITTANRGPNTNNVNYCPSRFTISGVLGNPTLNGVYNTSSCPDSQTIILSTPGVPSWTYPNTTLPEPVIGLTSGTVTSISGYSDLGGSDSAVTLALWETAPNQDMSKRANVIAGTLFHEIGHTLGLTHGGLYYNTPGSYIPTFDVNCKPNYQSSMNYLFQLDGVGPNAAVAYSNQSLDGSGASGVSILSDSSLGSVTQLTDALGNPATFATSAWYTPTAPSSTASPATMHCDGTPLNGDTAYRVVGAIDPITPAWSNGQNIAFDGVPYTQLLGYNDVANIDLRQVGATGGEFASLASVITFGSTSTPLNVGAGGNVTLGSGGTVTLGSGGNVTLGSGGNVTLGSGGTIALGSGGNVTLGSGGNVTLGSGGTVTPGSSGTVVLGSGGNVTLGSGGTITLGSGGTVTLGSGGNVTLGSGGTIALGSGGTVTIPSTGGSYTLNSSGGTVTLGSGGNVTLGSGGNVTLGSGGTIALGSGGNVTLGSGGNVTLGSGGTVTLGSGGNVTLGSGGNVTLGSGGTITLGSGGTVTLGSGGNVTLGSGGTVTQGSGGGNVTLGSGGTVTLGSGGTATVGAGGTVTLGSGGNVTLGSGGNVTLGSGGTIALGSGGTVTLGSGGNVTLGSGGTITLGSGGSPTTVGPGSYMISSGGTVTLGSGGTIALGSGGNVTLGSGGTITLGSGGTVTLGSGGNVTLGSGGTVTLGSGGTIALGSGGNVTLGSGGNITLGSGGTVTLGSGGNVTLGSGGNITLGSGGVTTDELTYQTANSVVRPPSSPTETPVTPPSGPTVVVVNWTAPAFGVVQTYTISRSVGFGMPIVYGTPVVIGSVSGVNGNPPATTFTDTNPPTSGTVRYTISTTLLPVTIDPSQGQSAPSPPAVLTNNQTIVLGSLPSSVTLSSSPVTVTATAESNSVPNGLQVSFTASGPCAIGSQSVSPVSNGAGGVSSATVTLSDMGTCIITASQPGTSPPATGTPTPPYYNAANAVSGSFMILSATSNTKSQTINFAPLANVQYGNTFSLSATSSSGETVGFTASGPCTTSGTISGVGQCSITASAPGGTSGNTTYSPASLTQSFNIYPASLQVTAASPTIKYGASIPPLTYLITGYVNGEQPSVVSGAPALSTTATATSIPGTYPITVGTGTLTAANYSFVFVNGTLTIQQANQSALTLVTTLPLTYNQTETLSFTGGSTAGTVTYNLVSGPCAISANQLTANSGTGSCTLTATMAGNGNYNPVTSALATVNLGLASQAALTLNVATPLTYNQSETLSVTGGSTGGTVTYHLVTGPCVISGSQITANSGTGSCTLTATMAGNGNYNSVTSSTATVNLGLANQAALTIVAATPLAYNQSESLSVRGGSTAGTVTYKLVSGPCILLNSQLTASSGGGSCTLTATMAGNGSYNPVTSATATVNLGLASQAALTLNAATPLTYNQTETLSVTGGTTGGLVSYNLVSGSCTLLANKLTASSGTGSCTLTATMAGNGNYSAVTSSPASLVSLSPVAQKITFTTAAPASAAYNSSFTVAATGGASGNAVTFTSAGSCTNAGTTYKMTNSTGTCSVIANQAGNTNYSMAPTVTQTVNATGPFLTVSPSAINFGSVALGSVTTQNITVTNTGTAAATISTPILSIVQGGNSNEFLAANLCPSPLAAGKSCTITIAFIAGPYYTPQTATLEIMDNAPGNPQPVTLSALVQSPQTITFTTNPPSTAAYKSSFTVAASASSGLAVTFTSAGSCTNSGAAYTMTSGTGTCSVIANQAGNSNYAAAAQVTKTVTATPAAQTITFTTSPPTSAAYKTNFTVAATGGASGNPVTFTSAGSCTNSGATYTMTSGTGTCSVIANQAGNSNYAAATQVTRTVSAAYSVASLTPASLSFGTVASGKSSTAQTVTLSNTGTTALIIGSIGLTGTSPGSFAQTNTCPSSSSSLAAGTSCTISVAFNSSGKAASASLTVTDNTQAGTQAVSLSGN